MEHRVVPSALCPLPSALCPLPSALCPLPSALCPLPSALCPLPPLLHSHPCFEVLQVSFVVALHLIDAVSAELLDHGRCDLEGRHRFRHHRCRGNGADIGTLHARLERL